MKDARRLAIRRKNRNRRRLRKVGTGRLRLCVFRSHQNIYAQIIDDVAGHTVASASSLDKDMRDVVKNGGTKDAAVEIGKKIAERAKAAGVDKVVFDRGGYLFHGRVKAFADAAREAGLTF
jgi:large subunit ribosomal protein L18